PEPLDRPAPAARPHGHHRHPDRPRPRGRLAVLRLRPPDHRHRPGRRRRRPGQELRLLPGGARPHRRPGRPHSPRQRPALPRLIRTRATVRPRRRASPYRGSVSPVRGTAGRNRGRSRGDRGRERPGGGETGWERGYLARFRRRKDRCARLAPTTTRATITNDPAIAAQNWTGPDGTSRITTPATRKDSPASATQGAALRWTYAQASGSRMVNGVRIPSRGLGRSLPRAPSAPVAISSSPATAKTT